MQSRLDAIDLRRPHRVGIMLESIAHPQGRVCKVASQRGMAPHYEHIPAFALTPGAREILIRWLGEARARDDAVGNAARDFDGCSPAELIALKKWIVARAEAYHQLRKSA